MGSEQDKEHSRADIDTRHDLKNYLDTIIQTSHDGILVVDSEGRFEFGNEAFFRTFGWPADELIGEHFIKVIPPELTEFMMQRWAEVQAGKGEPYETVILRKDGARRNLLVSHRHMTIGGQRKYCVITKDVTESKQAQDALQASQERFRQAAEHAQEWIWEVDTDGLYTYASPVITKILGYSPEEVVGKKHFYDLFHQEQLEATMKAAFDLFARRESFRELMNLNVHKNGQAVWLSTSGVPLFDKAGEFVGYRGADVDITERKRDQETVKFLSAITTQASDSVIATNLNFEITYSNKSFERLFGYSQAEILGKSPDMLNADPNAEAIQNDIHRTISAGETWKGEILNRRKDRSVFHCEMMVFPLVDKEGAVFAYAGHQRDITERKQIEEELDRCRVHLEEMVQIRTGELTEAQEMLRQVHRRLLNAGESERKRIAGNLHDSVGQKLVAMALSVQQTILGCRDTDGHEEQIKALQNIAQQCTETIREIRAICYGLYPPMLELTGLAPALQQLGRSCRPAFEFHFQCGQSLIEERFDPEQEIALFRIAQEAVSNAMRHGKPKSISMSLTRRDGDLIMTVSDDGIGFDTQSQVGQGLGLRSMTERARAVGGVLAIESEPGQTEVEASLPIRPAKA